MDLNYWMNIAGLGPVDIENDYRRSELRSAHLQQLGILGVYDERLMLCESPGSISGMELEPYVESGSGDIVMKAKNPRGHEIELCRSSNPPIIQLIQLMPYITPEYSDKLLQWSCMIDGLPKKVVSEDPSFKRMVNGWIPLSA